MARGNPVGGGETGDGQREQHRRRRANDHEGTGFAIGEQDAQPRQRGVVATQHRGTDPVDQADLMLQPVVQASMQLFVAACERWQQQQCTQQCDQACSAHQRLDCQQHRRRTEHRYQRGGDDRHVLLEEVDELTGQHNARGRGGSSVAQPALRLHHVHRQVGIDAGEGTGIDRTAGSTDQPEQQHHTGVGDGVADVAADDRVHREAGKQRIRQQQRVLQRHEREGAGELPGVGAQDGLEGGGRVLLADAAGGGRRIVRVFHGDAWVGRRQGRGPDTCRLPARAQYRRPFGVGMEGRWRLRGGTGAVQRCECPPRWAATRAAPAATLCPQRRACTGQQISNELPPRSVARHSAVP